MYSLFVEEPSGAREPAIPAEEIARLLFAETPTEWFAAWPEWCPTEVAIAESLAVWLRANGYKISSRVSYAILEAAEAIILHHLVIWRMMECCGTKFANS